jgi:thiol:disulfide interchange protein DsbC
LYSGEIQIRGELLMMKSGMKKVVVGLGFAVALAWGNIGHAAPVMEKPDIALRKAFPKLPFESIEPTDISGLYEVISGQNVYYYYPEKDYLFVGDIVAPSGRSITAVKREELAAKMRENSEKLMKNLPLDKAVKIGSGKTAVIEFTDPDCPYCRKAYEFFKNRTDITRYTFFCPLAHPAAITKVQYILDAADKEKAYNEMFEGKNAVEPATGYSEAAKKLAQEHLDLARSVGVTGTPTYFINGKLVVGADFKQIEKLIKETPQAGK